MRRVIIVLAKTPEETTAGLRSTIDAQAASCLHECFLLDTLEKAAAVPDADLVVCSATEDDLAFLQQVSPKWTHYVSGDGRDMATRMAYCFEQVRNPDTAIVTIGADAPTLPARSLELAFDALASENVDLVLGPCTGGGLYLIGMSTPHPDLLQNADWDNPQSIMDTAAALGLGWYMLPEWRCVKTPEDLESLRTQLTGLSSSGYSACRTREYLTEISERPHARILQS